MDSTHPLVTQQTTMKTQQRLEITQQQLPELLPQTGDKKTMANLFLPKLHDDHLQHEFFP